MQFLHKVEQNFCTLISKQMTTSKKHILLLKLMLILAFLLSISETKGQKLLLGNEAIGADPRIDSLFRTEFKTLENYEQRYAVKDPGFSMTDLQEPRDNEVYRFVDLLIHLSKIQGDSIITQDDWKFVYNTWDINKIEAWAKWYMQNGKSLIWEDVIAIKNEIDFKWSRK